MPLPSWAAGLTISTTALSHQEKQSIREGVEAGGGRYSPNLSKRTTHLVTPQVVNAVSDKLSAAISGDRFSGLQVVSCSWVAASVVSNTRADETQYAPSLPYGKAQLSADNLKTPANSNRVFKDSTSAVTTACPTAATPSAARQTPWVVHFSQMVDDSIYGMPDQPSPTATKHLAQQLQEQQLLPITEERTPPVSPKSAGRPHSCQGPSPCSGTKAAATWRRTISREQPTYCFQLEAPPAAPAAAEPQHQAGPLLAAVSVGGSPRSSDAWHSAGHIASRRPQSLQLPEQLAAAGTARTITFPARASSKPIALQQTGILASASAALAVPGSAAVTTELSPSHDHGSKQAVTNSYALGCTSCPGSVLSSPAMHGSSGRRVTNPREGALADQEHSLLLEQLPPEGNRALKRLSTQGYSSPTTTDSRAQQEQEQQQWQRAAGEGFCERSVQGSQSRNSRSSVEDVVLALRRVAGDSRRGTRDCLPSAAHAATAAPAAAHQNRQHSSLASVQQTVNAEAGAAASHVQRAAGSEVQGSILSSMDGRTIALPCASASRRSTADAATHVASQAATVPQTPTAAATACIQGDRSCNPGSSYTEIVHALLKATNCRTATAPAAAAMTPTTRVADATQDLAVQHIDSCISGSSVHELMHALKTATSHGREDMTGSDAAVVAAHSGCQVTQQPTWQLPPAAAAPPAQQQQHSVADAVQNSSTVNDLVVALCRAAANNDAGSAVLRGAVPDQNLPSPAQQQQLQQQMHHPKPLEGLSSVDELAAALQRFTKDSHMAVSAAEVVDPAAAGAPPQGLLSPLEQQQQRTGHLSPAMKRRAPGSARETAKSESGAAVTVTTCVEGLLQQQQQQQPQLAAVQDMGAQSSDVFGSLSNVDDLIEALRKAISNAGAGNLKNTPVATAGRTATHHHHHHKEEQQEEQQQQQQREQECQVLHQPASDFGSFGSADMLTGALQGPTRSPGAVQAWHSTCAGAEQGLQQQHQQRGGTQPDHPSGSVDAVYTAVQKAILQTTVGSEPASSAGAVEDSVHQQDGRKFSVDAFSSARGADTFVGTLQVASSGPGSKGSFPAKPTVPGEQQQQQQQEQQQPGSTEPQDLSRSMSSVDELIGALRHYTSTNNMGTGLLPADPATRLAAKLEAGWELPGQHCGDQAVTGTSAAAGVAASVAAGAGDMSDSAGSSSSINKLVQALWLVTSGHDHATSALLSNAEGVLAPAGASSHNNQPQQDRQLQHQQQITPQSEQQEDVDSSDVPGSLRSVNDLISALKRVTGDSRRSTTEAVVETASWSLPGITSSDRQRQQHHQRQTTEGNASSCMLGTRSSFDDLIGALQQDIADSRRSTAEAVAHVAEQLVHAPASNGQQQQQQHGLSDGMLGSSSNVDELLMALQHATANSKRRTANFAFEAAAIPPSETSQQLEQQQQGQQFAWPAIRCDVQEGNEVSHDVNELLHALRRTTAGAQEQQQRQLQVQQSPAQLEAPAAAAQALATPHPDTGCPMTTDGKASQLAAFLRSHEQRGQQQQQQVHGPQQQRDCAHFGMQPCANSGSTALGTSMSKPGSTAQSSADDSGGVKALVAALERSRGDNRRDTTNSAVQGNSPWQEEQQSAQNQHQQLAMPAQDRSDTVNASMISQQLVEDIATEDCVPGSRNFQGLLSAVTHATAVAALDSIQQADSQLATRDAAQPGRACASNTRGTAVQAEVAAGQPAKAAGADGLDLEDCSSAYKSPTSSPPEGMQPSEAAATATALAADYLQHSGSSIAAGGADAQEGSAGCQCDSTHTLEHVQQAEVSKDPATAAAYPETPAAEASASPSHGAQGAIQANQQSPLATLTVVFDPLLPVKVREQLAATVASAGGATVTGSPHLGCGANTVVAEATRAAEWLPLLMHIVSPAWLLKACRQQQQQLQQVQQLVRMSPDIARGLSLQGGQATASAYSSSTFNGDDSGMGQHNSAIPCEDTTTAVGERCGSDRKACSSSSSSSELPVLLLPPNSNVGSDGWLSAAAGTAAGQFRKGLLPPGLLEGVIWSVDQDPRAVGDEEAESVIFQGWVPHIILLLPQDSSGVLGHAAVTASASQPSKGLTCGDILATIYSFYRQQVLLQPALHGPVDSSAVTWRPSKEVERDCAAHSLPSSLQQRAANHTHSIEGPQVVVHRVQLLGARLLLEGLVRATTDPNSNVYELCLSG